MEVKAPRTHENMAMLDLWERLNELEFNWVRGCNKPSNEHVINFTINREPSKALNGKSCLLHLVHIGQQMAL